MQKKEKQNDSGKDIIDSIFEPTGLHGQPTFTLAGQLTANYSTERGLASKAVDTNVYFHNSADINLIASQKVSQRNRDTNEAWQSLKSVRSKTGSE